MTVNQLRAALPAGSNRTVVLDSGTRLYVTVIEHDRDAVYVGQHPAMLCLPYARITGVVR